MPMADYDQLPAGQRMNALVAAEIFDGPTRHPEWYWSRSTFASPDRDMDDDRYAGPRFSTHIADAWELVDRLISSAAPNGERWSVHLDVGRAETRCVVSAGGEERVEARAERAPLAICRAALKAARIAAGKGQAEREFERPDAALAS